MPGRPRKHYSINILNHIEAIAVKEGGVLGVTTTRDEAVTIRNSFYSVRAYIIRDPDISRALLGDMLLEMTARIVEGHNDIGEKQYTVEVVLNPLAAAARRAMNETPEVSFARRYNYAKQWGLEHLLVGREP